MMQWNPYLAFNGKCEAAFKFYEKCLGGKIVMMMRYGEMPPSDQGGGGEMPADVKNRIMHARLTVGTQVLMGGDCPPSMPYNGIHGNSVALQVDTPEQAEKVFAALSEGGNVTMPMCETFWAVRFGMLSDQFGVPWMVNCEKKM
ncbi:MAG: VOC family protein [Gemmatales bacterium]